MCKDMWESGDILPKDKWHKAIRILNEKALNNRYPYYPFYNTSNEYNSANWHNVNFTKEEIEAELLRIFKGYPKYQAHTEEGIKNDILYQSMLNMLGFMQDVGAYFGVLRVGHGISDDVIEAYIMKDKDIYKQVINHALEKYDEVFSKLYEIENIDKDIDDILKLEDKDEMKRELKALTLSHCKTIFDRDTESIVELKDAAISCVRTFSNENKEFIRLANILGNETKTSSEKTMEKFRKYLDTYTK